MVQNFTRKTKKNLENWTKYSTVKKKKQLAKSVMKKNILQIKSEMELGSTNKREKEEQKGGEKLFDMIKWKLLNSKISQTKICYFLTLMEPINKKID